MVEEEEECVEEEVEEEEADANVQTSFICSHKS